MDDCCWWWSSIPASKRASHMIIIGFLCVSLAAGLSNGGEYGSRTEHTETREGRHESPTFSLLRDAESSLSSILSALKHNSYSTDSQGEISSMSRHSNNYISENNKVKAAAATTNSAKSLSLSLSSTSLSRLNFSSHASGAASSPTLLRRSSPTSYRSHRGERLLHGGHMRRAAAPGHHLRVASQADATSSRRVRRKASNRGNPFVFEPKSPKQLFCRTGYRLAIHEDGTINGTKNTADIFSSLYIQAQSRSYVSIQGIYSKLYVCVDESGNLYGAAQMDRRSCLFQERFEPNFFNTYVFTMPGSSSRRRRRKTRYLSINKDGVTRVAKVRSPKKSHFLPITPPKELL
ncbi:uncharacterized protein [Diadema antillarum]|uniref:uncharacterized protein n=1 Tax=Diadema antillarum TaxID=105358 RepID=UPI003A8BFA19